MSSKDLNTLPFLDQLLATGIDVLKIEGRARAPEYVHTVVSCYREAIDAIDEGTYTEQKVERWQNRLKSVYNRGFFGGYYLGKKMGEWADSYGSKATRKKLYLGKGVHYFSKLGVGEFAITSHTLKKGDKLLITGPTTGVMTLTAEEIRVNDNVVDEAKRGDSCSIKLNGKIRPSDKLYKLVDV